VSALELSKNGSDQSSGKTGFDGPAGSLGSSSESKPDSKRVRRNAARARSKTRRKLQSRSGVGNAIAPEVVKLCSDRLEGIGVRLSVRGSRELFYFLQRILHATHKGASLPLRLFSSPALGRKIASGMLSVGLASCPDPDSWKPRDCDFRNAKGRRFLPTSELLLANVGLETVGSVAEYLSGKYKRRETRDRSEVILHPASPVRLSDYCTEVLKRGTGLTFNLEKHFRFSTRLMKKGARACFKPCSGQWVTTGTALRFILGGSRRRADDSTLQDRLY
jgi:hypothetical protein